MAEKETQYTITLDNMCVCLTTLHVCGMIGWQQCHCMAHEVETGLEADSTQFTDIIHIITIFIGIEAVATIHFGYCTVQLLIEGS